MKKEYIPNLITSLRIVGTVALLFTVPLSLCFFVIYILCGITDILDGFLARKLKVSSALGARLDSIADIIFYVVMAIKILPLLIHHIFAGIWYSVAVILLLRVTSYVYAFVKFRCFASIHTYLNKCTGLLVYMIPIMIVTPVFGIYQCVATVIAILATVEELIIHIITKNYRTDVKSLLYVKRLQEV